jgi:hypothetical protein
MWLLSQFILCDLQLAVANQKFLVAHTCSGVAL